MFHPHTNVAISDVLNHESCRRGQQVVPEWRFRTELEVLIERVSDGLIPLVSVVS